MMLIRPIRKVFSSVVLSKTLRCAAWYAARSWASSIPSGSGSARNRQAQSAGLSRGRTKKYRTASRASTATISAGRNQGTSRIVSVRSSWAMWIQYSCGSLTKIQIAAATITQNLKLYRSGFRRVRTPS